ncbi:copper resistance protein [Agrobacterium tumefaciens]|uniref:Copper tolerance protein n=1 Tax=Agrobacterium fabrum (strain C58 / ATCC 33970) TaxID=176299 RepID=A9CFX3_AGRFC|nr:TolC family protein [Agrobacterium fabrum]KEY50343.1 copper resistance protein [Agrobacterium tumefaciens]AAK89434.1 copper tolerance protein [Agrobacterium fabrum str. C58]MCX2878329.1 TolC family protein [Agrobacterium fabrum]NMV72949.1 TolC family protein [Agrobacterium fabrum]QQN08085.1 TolC family protein [Agrobacterium fabrum]
MMTRPFTLGSKLAAILSLPLFLSGCVSAAQYASRDAGFTTVSAKTSEATGKQTAWVQNRAEARATEARVKTLMAASKTLDVETAVQVALLNNKGLQAAYADLGESAATAWQSTLLVNPSIGLGLTGIGTPGLRAYKTIEGVLTSNILALATLKKNVEIADTGFRKAQLGAALKTLQLAADTRRAWISAVAASENVGQLAQAQTAAAAASELATKLGESGAMNKEGQAREQVFYAELTGQIAKARLEARLAREELTRLMGLWGSDIQYSIPNRLPSLPRVLAQRDTIEAEALQRRVDLQMAKLDLEATARSFKLTEATRYVTDLTLRSGFETERERDEDRIKKRTTGRAELEFVIPIFDSGQARMRESELAYMRAANLLAEKAVNVRSQARSAYQAYRSTYDIALHYRNSVVPLRNRIEEESMRTYNGMLTNTFELLADSREKVNSNLLAIDAKRDFWLAEAGLAPAIYGGGAGAAGGETEVAAASGGGGGGH